MARKRNPDAVDLFIPLLDSIDAMERQDVPEGARVEDVVRLPGVRVNPYPYRVTLTEAERERFTRIIEEEGGM